MEALELKAFYNLNCLAWDWSDSTEFRALALHLSYPGLIPDIPYGPQAHQEWLLSEEPGVFPEHLRVWPQNQIKKLNPWDQRDSTEGRTLALQAAGLGSILTFYIVPWASPEVIPEWSARRNPWVL